MIYRIIVRLDGCCYDQGVVKWFGDKLLFCLDVEASASLGVMFCLDNIGAYCL